VAGVKARRHHNTKGLRQVRRGKTYDQVEAMARRLKLPFGKGPALQGKPMSKPSGKPYDQIERNTAVKSEFEELKLAVLKYLSECDNPVPDYGYRRTLRNYLRTLAGAPKEPLPRS
jgi:hypothetical protein